MTYGAIHPAIRDVPWSSIPAMFQDSARRFAGSVAISDRGLELTYGQLKQEVDRLSRALVAVGIAPGDKVGLWLPNSAKWIICALALQQVGGVLVPLNTRFKAAELDYIFHKARPRLIFYQGECLGVDHARILDQTTWAPVVRVDVEGSTGDIGWQALLARADEVPQAEVERRLAAIGPTDLCDIMFTSGTTGRPKGVLCMHGQVLRGYMGFCKRTRMDGSDVLGLVVPFFHSFGYKAGWVSAFLQGAKVVTIQKLETIPLLELIAAERITYLPGPPTVFISLIQEPRLAEFDISSLRFTIIGSTSVPPSLIGEMRETLGFDAILQGYGITEATALGANSLWGDSDDLVANTAGRAHEELEMIVVDDGGNPLPPGEIGEIWLRGFSIMRGYFEDEAATREAVTPEGWLRTGDLGSLDGQGYVTIHGRKREMIIVGGFNAYPAEIESLLATHPAIAEAAVIGEAEPRLGEVPVAFVTLRLGATATEPELIAWARETMANFKVPRRFTILPELPRNASGKVVKGDLPRG